jgi:hypothetical protein
MPGVEFVERYRFYAARCIAISRKVSDPTGKLVLLDMAQSWLKLAEQAAGDAEPANVYESAIPDTAQRD